MDLGSLIIEVTRKCNMKCYHCLRGSAQKYNIDNRHIRTMLKQCSRVNHVVFTGGEPSLNVDAIEYFIKVAKELNVEVGSFYIATNGKNIKTEFIIAVLKLYALCDEKEMCSIQLSNDMYHAEDAEYNDELLKGLSFYSKRNNEDYAEYNLIRQGRSKYRGHRDLNKHRIENQDDFYEADIYLNVHGQVINGCDWSYLNQKRNIIVENVKDLKKYYEKLYEY